MMLSWTGIRYAEEDDEGRFGPFHRDRHRQ